jgi:hypothetical protein
LRDPLVVGIFAGALTAIIGAAVLLVWLLGPGRAAMACPNKGFCPPPSHAPRLVTQRIWRSPALRFAFEYDSSRWTLAKQSRTGAALDARVDGPALLVVEGVAGNDPDRLVDRRLATLRSSFADLAPNADQFRLLGANVGYLDGTGGAYCGTTRTGGGRVNVLVMGASDGRVSAAVTLLTPSCDANPMEERIFGLADSVAKMFRWPGQQ